MTPVLTHAMPTGLISSFSSGSKELISSTPWDPGILIPYAERAGSQLFPLCVGEKFLNRLEREGGGGGVNSELCELCTFICSKWLAYRYRD